MLEVIFEGFEANYMLTGTSTTNFNEISLSSIENVNKIEFEKGQCVPLIYS